MRSAQDIRKTVGNAVERAAESGSFSGYAARTVWKWIHYWRQHRLSLGKPCSFSHATRQVTQISLACQQHGEVFVVDALNEAMDRGKPTWQSILRRFVEQVDSSRLFHFR